MDRITKRRLLLFLCMMLFYSLNYFQRSGVPGTIFNQLQTDLAMNATQIGWISAAFIYIYSLSQIPAGILADKFGGVRLICAGGFLFVIGALIFPLCSDLRLLYFSRFLAGMGSSTIYLSLVRETERIFGREKYALLMGLIYFTGYSGGLLATLPFAKMLEIYSWRAILLAAGILSAILYLLILYLQHGLPPAPVRTGTGSFRLLTGLAINRRSWAVLYASTAVFATYFITFTVFGKKFLEDCAGMSNTGAAKVIFALSCTCMVTAFTSSLLTHLAGNRRKIFTIFSASGCFLGTAVMAAALHFHWHGTICAAVCILYAVCSGFTPVFTMLAQEVDTPERMTQSTAFVNTGNYLGVAVFSVLVGRLLDSFGCNSAGVYPVTAYKFLFLLLLIPTGLALLVTCILPDTRGKYLGKPAPPVRTAGN